MNQDQNGYLTLGLSRQCTPICLILFLSFYGDMLVVRIVAHTIMMLN